MPGLGKEVEKADEPKIYEFSWELVGYDCNPNKVRSPTFLVSFEVTEWYMELDLSKLQNIDSPIPFRLQRVPGIGPPAVIFDVKVSVKLGANKAIEKSKDGKIFSKERGQSWDFVIDIPFKLNSEDDDSSWLAPKNMTITVEMKSSRKDDPEFPKIYWHSFNSLKTVKEHLRSLYSSGYNHDLLLKVGSKEFKLHKCILNYRWPKLLSTLQVRETGMDVKEFSGIHCDLLGHLLEFAYCSNYDFMYKLHEIEGSSEIFSLVRKHNFYRLNDLIAQLSPKCSTSQVFQNYRSSVGMALTNVTSLKKAQGDFKTCEIPLKPRKLPLSGRPMTAKEREKFHQHIRFMDIRLYVDKGPFGYNWLVFSVVLGKIPQENPVTVQCKLYVVGKDQTDYLLTEENLVFDRESEVSFETSFSKNKTHKRYVKNSEPVITWEELTDERNNFMRLRKEKDPDTKQQKEKKDIYFRFEFKLFDGEYIHESNHDVFEFKYEPDNKIFSDLQLMQSDETFTDIVLTAGDRKVRAHKAILAARSRILKDDLERKANVLSLPIKIQPEYLRNFVQYIYTGQMQEIPRDAIDHFIEVAKHYDVEFLKELLSEKKRKLDMDIVA